MTQEIKTNSTKVITGIVRFSYLFVYKPMPLRAGEKPENAKYGASLIIPKTDKETVNKVRAAIKIAIENGKAGCFGGKVNISSLTLPLKDGDEKYPGQTPYQNAHFIRAKNNKMPGVVDRAKRPIPADSTNAVYSGCYGKAILIFYPYNFNGMKGVKCELNGIQKIKDGEPLVGSVFNVNDFDEGNEQLDTVDFSVEDEDDEPEDLDEELPF